MENQEKKLGQEPAFACESMTDNGNYGHLQKGMSKRFYAACQITPGFISAIIANEKAVQGIQKMAKECNVSPESTIVGMIYEYVDELLKQENE